MTDDERLAAPGLRAPKALLLDFGGVIVETKGNPDWPKVLAACVHDRLAASGAGSPDLTVEVIERDINAAAIADSHWKNAMSRMFAPLELTYAQFWGDFVAADWPGAARDAVLGEAKELCRIMGHVRSARELRRGILDLLDAAEAARVPVAIVSNALSGQVHNEYLTEHELIDRFAVVVHSDTIGVRKPNPEMILWATRHLGVAPTDAWYVGDTYDRDVLCGLRAGIGAVILMESIKTHKPPYDLRVRPDAVVADPVELLNLFRQALVRTAT